MYLSLNETRTITIKTEHEFRVYAQEGFFEDNLKLFVDEMLLVHAKINIFKLKGYQLFDVDGRTLEFRWVWNRLSGNPNSIVIMHKERILAQIGSDKAANDSLIETDEE